MRLDRFLSRHTGQGRRAIRLVLAAGRVCVNQQIETNGQRQIDSFSHITLDHHILSDNEAVYLMLHKPAGYLSATSDPEHPTVMELIHPDHHPQQLHLAGRLDRATTGLLLLTNDGHWSRLLTDPADDKHQGIGKIYHVKTAEPISQTTRDHFEQGIYFAYEDLTTQPADLEILSEHSCRLTIYEGRYHQVKRMFHAVGNRVTALHRTQVGPLVLDPDLEPGQSRRLTRLELQATFNLIAHSKR